jgi:hypothetical protein
MCPDKRRHRGAHPEDVKLFHVDQLSKLQQATSELAWLLERNYSMKASLKLVGDHYGLHERQRLAISRAVCPETNKLKRLQNQIHIEDIKEKHLIIDGFNLLITLEAAFGGGVLLYCQDNCIRDLSSVHGSYRSVEETEQAICLVGEALKALEPKSVVWLLDKPISNSGRLAMKITDLAGKNNWPWSVDVVFNPDNLILKSDRIAVTSDSAIVDHVKWINLNLHIIDNYIKDAWIIDLKI